jgi:hypothetical protein
MKKTLTCGAANLVQSGVPERRGRANLPLDGDARIATHRRTERQPVRRFSLDFSFIVSASPIF